MGSHRATRPEVRQTLRARAEAKPLISNIMPLNCWIHCNTNLCAGVRMCFSLLLSTVGDWLARWVHCACYRRAPRCVVYIDAHDSLRVWQRRWLKAVKLWRRQTAIDCCCSVQEALLSWLICTAFLVAWLVTKFPVSAIWKLLPPRPILSQLNPIQTIMHRCCKTLSEDITWPVVNYQYNIM